jgi:hypothetical protein
VGERRGVEGEAEMPLLGQSVKLRAWQQVGNLARAWKHTRVRLLSVEVERGDVGWVESDQPVGTIAQGGTHFAGKEANARPHPRPHRLQGLKGLHLFVDYAGERQEQLQGPVGMAGVERCLHLVD